MELDDKTKADVLAQFPEALTVTIPETAYEGEYVCMVKRVPRPEWKRFRSMLADEGQRADALEALTKGCIVWPSLADFNETLKTRPGLAEAIGGELVSIAGLVKGASTKK